MDIEKIVEKITKDVIERIITHQTGEEGAKNVEESRGQLLVILPRFTMSIEKYLSYIKHIESLVMKGRNQEMLPVRENKLITEEDIDVLWESGKREISCGKGCIITPLAQDRAREIGLRISFNNR